MRLFNMLSTEELEKFIKSDYEKLIPLAQKDGVFKELGYKFEKPAPNTPIGNFVYSENNSYHFVSYERGQEGSHKITDDVFEISFWAIYEMVRDMSMKYELNNRKSGQDSRRIIFFERVKLLGAIGENYKKRGEIEISCILKVAPYDDSIE